MPNVIFTEAATAKLLAEVDAITLEVLSRDCDTAKWPDGKSSTWFAFEAYESLKRLSKHYPNNIEFWHKLMDLAYASYGKNTKANP
jgi:hypothetical protein